MTSVKSTGFVVEIRIGAATARVYVATRERADEIAGQAPGRTVRELTIAEMPEKARVNLLAARVA